jgi:hypothetical protein
MYPSGEIDLSQRYLGELFRGEAEPCLLGGWAVYLTVNESYRAATGRDYIGSRDIDVGFHIDTSWNREELSTAAFGSFLKRMNELGFQSQSFRLYRDFDHESLRPLSPEEANAKPAFDVEKLYVDPVVDRIHPLMPEIFGFTPIDEPLLEATFTENLFKTHSVAGVEVKVVAPHLLLATKLNSAVIRIHSQKRVKDVADIYALIWYSGLSLEEMRDSLQNVYLDDKTEAVIGGIKDDEIREVGGVLGVEPREIRRVLRFFSKT